MLQLPLTVPDPIFLCQLALEFKMSLKDLGERMSAHELGVIWPVFFSWRAKNEARERARAEALEGRR